MKKIGIVITRGMVARNILRTGIIEKMLEKQNDCAVIVFTPHACVETLQKELHTYTRINIVGIDPKKQSGWFRNRYLNVVLRNLVYTRSAQIVSFFGKTLEKKRENLIYKTIFASIGKLGKNNAIKKFVRWMEVWIFQDHWYDAVLFDNWVDLMFLPDVNGRIDSVILKHCKRAGIKTVGMSKGWDTVNQRLLPVLPDTLIVQNDTVYSDAIVYQGMDPKTLVQTGFPQFDLYARRDWSVSYETFCKQKNFDPTRVTLLYGPSGSWSKNDEEIVELLLRAIKEKKIIADAQIIIRPHFSDITQKRYDRFKTIPQVFIDDDIAIGPFTDEWNPGKKEMESLANELLHSKVLISFASTLALDGALMDIPLINVGFGAQRDREGNDKTYLLYELTHYQPILESGAVELVLNEETLISKINEAIQNPTSKTAERKNLRERMVRLSDGNASNRIAETIIKNLG